MLLPGYFPLRRINFMLYAVYLDGSGKINDPGSDHVVLAGVVFHAEAMEKFGPAWGDCFRKHARLVGRKCPNHLHTTEAYRCAGEFEGWKPEQVQSLLLDLATLTRDQCSNLIAAPANKKDFLALPDSFRRKLRSVGELSFEICLNELIASLGETDQIHIACDDEESEAMKMYALLNRYKLRYQSRRDRIAAICFADDRCFPALQAADLFAYTERREMDRILNSPAAEQDPLYKQFTANGQSLCEYQWSLGKDGLGSAEKVVS
jgi:Protein of unknown function (DUF3800)